MSDDRWTGFRALAPAFTLGALGAEAEAGFRLALAGSPDLQEEVSRYVAVAARLGLGGALRPPPELKARLMAAVRQDAEPSVDAGGEPVHGERGFTAEANLDALAWTRPALGHGFEVHWLRRNEASGEMALLLRGAPGATYPDHVHPGGEHFYVLHGSFIDHQAEYRTGDSDSFPPGSVHRDLRVTGVDPCVILVITGPGGIAPLTHRAGE